MNRRDENIKLRVSSLLHLLVVVEKKETAYEKCIDLLS